MQEHFTLKQVAESIRKTIEQRYARTYWVSAEMHKLNLTRKGHCYPELVQKEGDDIVVEMRATIWKNSFENIQRKFVAAVREPLSDGMELLFQVRITYHPIYNIGLEIIDIDPNYTLGALHRERQATIERLSKEGILNANQQLTMPLVPKRLAIISQAGSKGYSDFEHLLNGHPNNYKFDCFLFEATLQGDAAIASINKQFDRILRVQHHFDAVVIIRGGGGEVGMHCYNNYELAKRIATCPLPVLTGIGHSTNHTVCELIAYSNGITPSDLAYSLLRIFEEREIPLQQYKKTLPHQLERFLKNIKQEYAFTVGALTQGTSQRVQKENTKLSSQGFALVTKSNAFIHLKLRKIEQTNQNLLHAFSHYNQLKQHSIDRIVDKIVQQTQLILAKHDQQITNKAQELYRATPARLSKQQLQLNHYEQQLRLLDPQAVLNRGYAIVTSDAGIVQKSTPTRGTKLKITTSNLTFEATAD